MAICSEFFLVFPVKMAVFHGKLLNLLIYQRASIMDLPSFVAGASTDFHPKNAKHCADPWVPALRRWFPRFFA